MENNTKKRFPKNTNKKIISKEHKKLSWPQPGHQRHGETSTKLWTTWDKKGFVHQPKSGLRYRTYSSLWWWGLGSNRQSRFYKTEQPCVQNSANPISNNNSKQCRAELGWCSVILKIQKRAFKFYNHLKVTMTWSVTKPWIWETDTTLDRTKNNLKKHWKKQPKTRANSERGRPPQALLAPHRTKTVQPLHTAGGGNQLSCTF